MRSDSGDKRSKREPGFRFAWNGIKITMQEWNFRIHMIVALFVILAGIIVRLNMLEWSIIILTIGMVMALEMVNTSIETLLDYLQPDCHPTAKMIKDISAGAVLVSAVVAVVIGVLIFLPKIYYWF